MAPPTYSTPPVVRFLDRAPVVQHLQLALLRRDPTCLPRWGADGALGAESWAALDRAADFLRLDPVPPPVRGAEVPAELVAALLVPERDDENESATCTASSCGGARLYDLRDQRVASSPKISMVGTKPRLRAPSAVVGVVLHQCGVRFSVSSQQLRAANGDRALALARRALGVACHAAAFVEHAEHPPLVVAASPLLWHVNHGNAANPISLGLEVDGVYEGIQGDARTRPGGATPTPSVGSTIDAARAALRWLVEQGRAEGMPIRYVWAHRQSSATRRADPGSWLWREVGLWSTRALGLEVQPTRTWGEGRAIPEAWGGPSGVAY